jgi:hypothetical protein
MLCEGSLNITQIPRVIQDIKLSNYGKFHKSAMTMGLGFGIVQRETTCPEDKYSK